ncbi:hypothetical protein C8J57DRAFT_107411 [Mycena rebaudengoi]|nr:hypothetical protein C8J57DRAFT_107411 [Mycena rebaudengoi]
MDYFHLSVFFTGGLIWSPANMSNIWPAMPVAYVFNVLIKERYLAWWSKYNYITTMAFAAAIALSGIFMFFAISWPCAEIIWSGNTRPFEGYDGSGCPHLPSPEIGYFGPVRRLCSFVPFR